MYRSIWIVVASCLLATTGWADDADFGDTVTTDIKLTGDISGSGDGLIVGANGITIDLNGYTISSTDGTGVGINNSDGYHGLTIKGGTIEDFSQGVLSDGGDDLLIEKLTVDGAFGDQGSTGAIHVLNADDVEIKECDISVETFFLGAQAIRLDSVSDAKVTKCDIAGGFVGISFFSVTQQDDPTTGTVEDCTVEDCFIGILMGNTDDAEVKSCEVKDGNPTIFGPAAPQGIRVGFDEIGVSGITVEDNECTNAGVGILVFAGFEISDIEIEDNVCNDGNRGILTVLMVDSKVEGNTCNGNTLFGMAFNDSDALTTVFSDIGKQIACVIVEPIAGNMNMVPPEPGFHETLRTLCTLCAPIRPECAVTLKPLACAVSIAASSSSCSRSFTTSLMKSAPLLIFFCMAFRTSIGPSA